LSSEYAKLVDVSESGSRYYRRPDGRIIRVSDHEPNATTQAWLGRHAEHVVSGYESVIVTPTSYCMRVVTPPKTGEHIDTSRVRVGGGLTPAELEARRSRVGASDVASIFGIPTFKGRNAFSTWLDKTDQLEPEKRTSAAINAGNTLEPVILDHAEALFGPLARNVVVHDPQGCPIASTLDGQVIADGRVVEAKTSGIFGPVHGSWGEADSADVPDGYYIQCQTQLLCTVAEVCELVALLGGRGFVQFHIEPIDGVMDQIRAVTTDFFERYVLARRDPRSEWGDRLRDVHGVPCECDPCEPVLETVRRYRKVPAKVIAMDAPEQVEAVLRWQRLNDEKLSAKKAADTAQAEVLANLGDAEAAELPGGGMLTHRETTRKAHAVAESTYRALRFKKGK